MLVFFITLFALLTIVTAMSVGVLMGRKPISGSCGGVGAALGEKDYVCDICGGDPSKCDEQGGSGQPESSSRQSLFYEAGRDNAKSS